MASVGEGERTGGSRPWGIALVYLAAFALTYATVTGRISLTAVLAVCLAGVIGGVVVLFAVILRQMRRAQADLNHGIAALARGQLQHAHELFDRWSAARDSTTAAVARHNLGWTLLRQARLEEALAVFSDNDVTHERALRSVAFHATSSADLALTCALLDRTDEAASWIARTDQRASAGHIPSLPAMRVFASAVLACRQDRCDDAARLLDERWAGCESTLTGAELRPLRVVRAFAVAAAGPRDAGIAERHLAAAAPTYEGEYEFLGAAWPAMHAFLVIHPLVRVPPRRRDSDRPR